MSIVNKTTSNWYKRDLCNGFNGINYNFNNEDYTINDVSRH